MIIESKYGNFEWIEDWVKIPQTESGKINGRTHGIIVSKTGHIYIFHQANPSVLVYDPEGKLVSSWGNYPGAHSLTLVEEAGTEFLWITDHSPDQRVEKTTLDGKVVQTIQRPDLKIYSEKKYSPTWVAVDEIRFGGSGNIWVTDGYGSNLIHCYTESGKYVSSIDGTEGSSGKFNCPHGIFFDLRRGEPELYIADRGNKRVQVYSREGHYKRVFGSDFMNSPDGFITIGENLIVPELSSRLTILNRDDQLIDYIGRNDEVCSKEKGWPNNRAQVVPGKFNSPHGVAADASGNIYMVEWITGGRITKLKKI